MLKYRERPIDDLWTADSVRIPVVSKTTFRKIWQTKFNDVKIGKVAKDTCGTCWDYKNQLKRIDSIASMTVMTLALKK